MNVISKNISTTNKVFMKKKILAIILARKNSKRLPKKNLKKIGNKTLVEWSIHSLKNVKEVENIFVSTDDPKILKIAKKNGVLSPWLRPKYLSKDNTSSELATMHALKWYEKNVSNVDGFFLIQPTTPFRSKRNLKKAIKIFQKINKPIISVSRVLNDIKYNKLVHNGSFYLSTTKYFKKYNNLNPKIFYPFILKKREECLDINTIEEFNLAKKYYNNVIK